MHSRVLFLCESSDKDLQTEWRRGVSGFTCASLKAGQVPTFQGLGALCPALFFFSTKLLRGLESLMKWRKEKEFLPFRCHFPGFNFAVVIESSAKDLQTGLLFLEHGCQGFAVHPHFRHDPEVFSSFRVSELDLLRAFKGVFSQFAGLFGQSFDFLGRSLSSGVSIPFTRMGSLSPKSGCTPCKSILKVSPS